MPAPGPQPDPPTEEEAELAEAAGDELPETVPDAYEQAASFRTPTDG